MVMEGTTLNNSMNKKQIHFYTYGDSKKYKVSKKHLIHLAKLSGLFDKLYSFSLNDVPKIEKYPYNLIFNNDRGGGYWVWKYLILEKLYNVNHTAVTLEDREPIDIGKFDENGNPVLINTLRSGMGDLTKLDIRGYSSRFNQRADAFLRR